MRFLDLYKQFFITIIMLSVTLTGCKVGPNFHTPCAPKTQTYTKSPLPVKTASIPAAGTAGKAQFFSCGQDIPAEWWTLFHSPELNELIQRGLRNSPNLAAAQATLRQAQENWYAQIGTSLWPNVNAQFVVNRQRFSQSTFGDSIVPATTFNLFNPTINVTYT